MNQMLATAAVHTEAAPTGPVHILIADQERCEYACVTPDAMVMLAEGAGIGFVYARLTAGEPLPDRLMTHLPSIAWMEKGPAVIATLQRGSSVTLHTAVAAGAITPDIIWTTASEITPQDAACNYLVNYGDCIVDPSLTRFTRRVLECAHNHNVATLRGCMLSGLLDLHCAQARFNGVRACLDAVASGQMVALRHVSGTLHPLTVRMGPFEIRTWLAQHGANHSDLEWSASYATDTLMHGLPLLRGDVYVCVSRRLSSTSSESVVFAIPDDETITQERYARRAGRIAGQRTATVVPFALV